jgi:hypothetical protein
MPRLPKLGQPLSLAQIWASEAVLEDQMTDKLEKRIAAVLCNGHAGPLVAEARSSAMFSHVCKKALGHARA